MKKIWMIATLFVTASLSAATSSPSTYSNPSAKQAQAQAVATQEKAAAAVKSQNPTGQYMPDKRAYPDTQIFTKIRETFTDLPYSSELSNINYEVYNGVVTLHGTIDSQETNHKVIEVVKSIPGVSNVVSQISVKGKTVDTTRNSATPSKSYSK